MPKLMASCKAGTVRFALKLSLAFAARHFILLHLSDLLKVYLIGNLLQVVVAVSLKGSVHV